MTLECHYVDNFTLLMLSKDVEIVVNATTGMILDSFPGLMLAIDSPIHITSLHLLSYLLSNSSDMNDPINGMCNNLMPMEILEHVCNQALTKEHVMMFLRICEVMLDIKLTITTAQSSSSIEELKESASKVWIILVLSEYFGCCSILDSCLCQLHGMICPDGCVCCEAAECAAIFPENITRDLVADSPTRSQLLIELATNTRKYFTSSCCRTVIRDLSASCSSECNVDISDNESDIDPRPQCIPSPQSFMMPMRLQTISQTAIQDRFDKFSTYVSSPYKSSQASTSIPIIAAMTASANDRQDCPAATDPAISPVSMEPYEDDSRDLRKDEQVDASRRNAVLRIRHYRASQFDNTREKEVEKVLKQGRLRTLMLTAACKRKSPNKKTSLQASGITDTTRHSEHTINLEDFSKSKSQQRAAWRIRQHHAKHLEHSSISKSTTTLNSLREGIAYQSASFMRNKQQHDRVAQREVMKTVHGDNMKSPTTSGNISERNVQEMPLGLMSMEPVVEAISSKQLTNTFTDYSKLDHGMQGTRKAESTQLQGELRNTASVRSTPTPARQYEINDLLREVEEVESMIDETLMKSPFARGNISEMRQELAEVRPSIVTPLPASLVSASKQIEIHVTTLHLNPMAVHVLGALAPYVVLVSELFDRLSLHPTGARYSLFDINQVIRLTKTEIDQRISVKLFVLNKRQSVSDEIICFGKLDCSSDLTGGSINKSIPLYSDQDESVVGELHVEIISYATYL